jgi:hypothetical protein
MQRVSPDGAGLTINIVATVIAGLAGRVAGDAPVAIKNPYQ